MKTQRLVEILGLTLAATAATNCTGGDATGPATCKEAQATYGVHSNGAQTLYVGGNKSMPWSAYCAAMDSSAPQEYLELPQFDAQGRPANYADFIESNAAPAIAAGTPAFEVRTHYDKVRIDPIALTIDITDNTFTHTEATQLPSGGAVTPTSVALGNLAIGYMPYGVAMQCGQDTNAAGQAVSADANIDLAGLPFVLTAETLCSETGGSTAVRDATDGSAIVNFHALGQTATSPTGTVVTCGRASVSCLPFPTVNGKVGGETTVGLAYAGAVGGFGF